MNMSKEEKNSYCVSFNMSSFSYLCNNNFGEYVFSYTGLDYEDLCRRNDYCIHSNYSSSFNEKIEIIF